MTEENKSDAVEVVKEEEVVVVKEGNDIYAAQGYVAEEFVDQDQLGEEERGYFESGYMTLPDEDPDEEKQTFVYPENYKEIADMQLRILEQQYNAVLSGSTLPSDTPLTELKKNRSELLPKPVDVVGDEKPKAPKKKKPVKKEEKKKTWTRDEILNTFLPPPKQKGGRQATRAKQAAPAKQEKKEKKPMPKAVVRDTPRETDKMGSEEKNELIQSTMQAIQMTHKPKWATHMDDSQLDELVKKVAKDIASKCCFCFHTRL